MEEDDEDSGSDTDRGRRSDEEDAFDEEDLTVRMNNTGLEDEDDEDEEDEDEDEDDPEEITGNWYLKRYSSTLDGIRGSIW